MKKTLRMKIMLLLCALVVGIGNSWATDVTFIAGTDTSTTTSITKDGITISVTSGTFNREDNYRCYAKNTMTISSEVGNISNISFTFSGSYTGGWETSYSPNSNTWTSASASGQARITQIVVSYTPSGGGGGSTYTVTYDCNGGTSGCPENVTGITAGTSITLAAAPSKTDYTFDGWSDGTITYDAGDSYTVNGNVTMTAQWTENTGGNTTVEHVYNFAGANNFYTDANLTTHPSSGNSNNVGTIYYSDGSAFVASGTNRYFSSASSGYFMLGKTGAQISLPTFDGYKITQVIVHTSGSVSTNVQVSIVSGSNTASAAQKWATNSDFTYNIDEVYQTSALSLNVTNNYNSQFTSITIECEQLSTGPIINATDPEALVYNAAGGEFGYSITNPTSATLNAVSNADWITNVAVGETTVTFNTSTNTAFTQRTGTITLSYNEANDKVITITQNAAPAPSINAENVEINYNATGGDIAYTINDGIEGGSVSASVPNNSWITLPNTFASPIEFTCGTTEGVVARTETVTLTYTYNTTQTVTKEVTVTQGVDATLGTADNPYTVAQARTFIDGLNGATSANGKHVSGIISQVDSYSNQYNSITYWISDDGTTTSEQLYVYSGKGISGAAFSAETDVAVGAEVVVKGKLKYYSNQSVYEFDYDNELVSYTAPVVPNPTITIAAGLENYIITDPKDDAAAGTTVQIGIFPPDNQVLRTLTVTKANEETVDVSPAVSGLVTDYTFNMPASNVTISATFVDTSTTTTILYSVNGVDDEVMLYTTEGYELPDLESSQIPEGFDFAGWTLYETASPIVLLDENYVPANDDILTAVFSREEGAISGDFTKVTSDQSDWSGNYLFVAVGTYANSDEYSVAFDGNLTTLDAANNTIDVEIDGTSIKGNKVNSKSVFTIAAITENEQITGWSIKSARGYYIGRNTNGNGMNSDQETVYSHSLSIDDGYNAVITSSAGPVMRYNKNANDKRFRYYKNGQEPIMLFKQGAGTPGTTKYYTRILPSNPVVNSDIKISGPTIIESGTVLDMGSYAILCDDATKLIIEDGAQLKFTNTESKADVKATVQKNITGYGNDNSVKTGWNFIASPITESIAPSAVTNLLGEQTSNNPATYNYDLYRLNNTDWENYHQHNGNEDPFMLANGQGYLYAKSSNTTLSFVGTIKPYDDTYEISVSKGWNLVGNPYTFDAYANTPYYAMNAEGTGITANTVTTSTAVKPCTGIIIKAAGDGNVKFLDEAPVGSANNSNLQITLAHNVTSRDGASVNSTLDNAIVSFNEGTKLQKFYFGEPAANIYIPQNGEDYAIAFSNRQGDMPLNFKTTEAGMYTISFEGDNMDLKGVCLIDMLAEEEIDLSVDPSYTFIGSPADKAERFKIVFRGFFDGASDDIFAFQSGSDIIVSGEGELQIFDVMGRKVKTQYVSGVQTVNVNSQGVYIMKLNEKTQKIIVR